MIGFDLSEEQVALQDMVAKFVKNEIIPVAAEYDKLGMLPMDVAQKAHELGLINAGVPEEYGGAGMGMMESCLIAEGLTYGCAGIATSLLLNSIAAIPIMFFGTSEQKEKYLKLICESEEIKFISFAVTEPGAGSDVAAITTKADKKNSEYIINGRKTFITNGDLASIYVVLAKTDPSKAHKGMSAFIVPRGEGIIVGKKEDKMGIRASHTVELIFEDVRVPEKNLLGKEGQGFAVAMEALDRSRALAAATALGLAQRALDESLKYACQRVQFGKPLISQQLIQKKLAEMSMEIDAARLLTWRAAWMVDQGKLPILESSQAKAMAGDAAVRAAVEAVQIFGGYGYSKEYPVEKLYRDAKIFQIYEGTNEIQRLVIAAELAKKVK